MFTLNGMTEYTVTEVLGEDVETIGNFTLTDDSDTDGSATLTMDDPDGETVELKNTYEEICFNAAFSSHRSHSPYFRFCGRL